MSATHSENPAPDIHGWRSSKTCRVDIVELFGWRERSGAEWRNLFSPDIPLYDALLRRIEAVSEGTGRFRTSGRYPEPAGRAGYCPAIMTRRPCSMLSTVPNTISIDRRLSTPEVSGWRPSRIAARNSVSRYS